MSDSEFDDFRIDDDGSESDYYVAPSKGKKAAVPKKKAPAAKAPAAKKAAPKKINKAPLASKKHPNESLSDAGSDTVCSPPKKKTKADDDDGDFGTESSAKAPTSNKNASEVYQKLSQREHVLKRPDTYIGSVEAITQPMWILNPETKTMVHRPITFVPGFLKIFDEILVNASDNKVSAVCVMRSDGNSSTFTDQ